MTGIGVSSRSSIWLPEYLFVSDGDLYRYDGKEKTRVQTNVDYIWTRTAEPYYEMSTGYNSPMYQDGY